MTETDVRQTRGQDCTVILFATALINGQQQKQENLNNTINKINDDGHQIVSMGDENPMA